MTIPDLGELTPLNDLDLTIVLEDINTSTGTRTPITTGTVTGFLATSSAPDATTADATLSVSGVYIGGQTKITGQSATYDAGTWLFHLDASALTIALLDEKFAAATPYFIVSKSNAVRKVGQLSYSRYSAGG
jgi:hypothetical protein